MNAFNYLTAMVTVITELLEGRIEVQRHYFDTVAAVWAMFLEPVMAQHSFFVPFRFLQAAGIATFGACSASKNRRLHAGAIVLIVVLLVTGITIDRFQLGQYDHR